MDGGQTFNIKTNFISWLNYIGQRFIDVATGITSLCYRIIKISLAIFPSMPSSCSAQKKSTLENKKIIVINNDNSENLIDRPWSEISKAISAKGLAEDLFDHSLYSPLQAAVLLQDFELCKKMVELSFSINSPEKKFKQPLLSIALGNISKEIDEDLYKKNWWYNIRLCSQGGYIVREKLNKLVSQEIALYLIEQGADLTYETKKGHTYLHFAAELGYEKVCKLLFDKGVDVNKIARGPSWSEKEITPLLTAVIYNQESIVRMLLEKGAIFSNPAINFFNRNENPFYCALEKGNEKIIQAFLDHGGQLDQEIDWLGGGTYPLLLAIDKNRSLFELAVNVGINFENKFGIFEETYLHLAVSENNISLCEFLIQSGANIHALDARNMTVLHKAARNKNAQELLDLLLQKGANARVVDMCGKTPLMNLQESRHNKGTTITHAPLEKADNGFSSLMTNLRFLGLRYSLQGAFFEGDLPLNTFAEAARSLKSFLKSQQNLPSFFYSLPEVIQNAAKLSAKDFLLQLEQNQIIAIAYNWNYGYVGHATSIIMTNEILIKCNRGDECGNEPGMTIYKIKKSSNISEAINTLISNRDSADQSNVFIDKKITEKHIEFFKKGLSDLLDLEIIAHVAQEKQLSGNCPWLAAKMAIRGCLISHYLQEKLLQNSLIDIKEILNLCNIFMLPWKEYDYTVALEILKKAETEPEIKNIINIENLYDELFTLNFHRKKTLKRLCELRPRLLEWKTNLDPKLILYGYKHENAKIIKWLLDHNVEPDMSAFLKCNSARVSEIHYDYFLKNGIKANVSDVSGRTPLHVFCMKSRSSPENNVSLTTRLIAAWKKECELSNNPQLLTEALNSTENELTLLQYLIKDNDNLTPINELIDIMKKNGAK